MKSSIKYYCFYFYNKMKMLAKGKVQKEKDCERQKRRRSQLSEQELEIQRAKDREAKRLSRAKETPEQKKLRRQKDREKHRLFRAHQSYDQKQARLKRERELRRRARAQEKLALAPNWLKLDIQTSPNDTIQTEDTFDNQPVTVSTVEQKEIYKSDSETNLKLIIKQEEISDDTSSSIFKQKDYLPSEDNTNLSNNSS